MATLSYQTVKTVGTTPTFAAASAGGDEVAASDRGWLHYRNGGASSVTITVVTPGNTKYGAAIPDITVTVAAGADAAIGPLPSDLIGSDGFVAVTYSAVTSLTVAALTI